MATPGFGYSAGDFFAAATLIVKVTKALKDAGGARAEYQTIVSELDQLTKLLTELRRAQPPSTSQPATTAGGDVNGVLRTFIDEQTEATISEVTGFLRHLSKFASSLGETSRAGWHRGMSRKAQWAIQYASEVKELRAKLQIQLEMILLVLNMSLNNSMKSATEQLVTGQHMKRQDFESIVETGISNLITPQLNDLRHQSQALLLDHRALLNSARNFGAEHRSCTQGIEDRIDRGVSDLLRHMSEEARRNKRCKGSSFSWTSQTELTHSTGSASDISERTQGIKKPTTTAVSRAQSPENEGVKRLLFALLRAIVGKTGKLLLVLTSRVPQWSSLLYSLHFTLIREPMLAHADCIMFEDMMGQGVTLDYRYYRDWRTFETFLLKRFSSSLGSRHVAQRMYRMMWNGTVIQNSEWSQTVRPGSQVIMFGLVPKWKTTGESCPKPGCHGQGMRRGNNSLYECRQCGVVYAEDQGGQGVVEGQGEEDDTIPSDLCAGPSVKDESEEARFRRINVTWDLGGQSTGQTAEMNQASTHAEVTTEIIADQSSGQTGEEAQASTQPEIAAGSPTDAPIERTMERNQAPTRGEVAADSVPDPAATTWSVPSRFASTVGTRGGHYGTASSAWDRAPSITPRCPNVGVEQCYRGEKWGVVLKPSHHLNDGLYNSRHRGFFKPEYN